MKNFFLLLALTASLCIDANAVSGSFRTKTGVIDGGYNFCIYTPEKYLLSDTIKRPLIIFLHGASLCGNNIARVRRYGVLHAIDRGMEVEAMVVAPQNPGGAWKPTKINDVIEWVKSNYQIDTAKIYVMGMSLGGYGTLDFVNKYPEKISAAMALCGGCSNSEPEGLGKVPLWIMHGTSDRAVSLSKSRIIVDYLKQNNADSLLRYSWIPGANHGYLARVFYLKKSYEWLLSHSLTDTPRVVNRSVVIKKSDLNSAY